MNTLRCLLTGLVCTLVLSSASCQVADSNAITNEAFRKIAAGKKAVILDVRTLEEFNEGHLPDAVNIDVLQPGAFKQYIASLPKEKTYLLYCRSGKRSGSALTLMKEHGFTDVSHLKNGIVGWDGPTVK